MRILRFGMIAVLAAAGFADTVTLKNGQVISGTYLGGSSRQVRIETGDQIRTLDISEVVKIEFLAPVAAPAAPVNAAPAPPAATQRSVAAAQPAAAPRTEPLPRRPAATAPAPQQASAGPVELPAGTNLVVRMIDGIDSETNGVGQTFAASLDEPVIIDGQTAVPRGADVVVRLVDSKDSGKLTGRAELTLNLVSVKFNGKVVDINSRGVSRESESRGTQTAKVAGGTAAVGAIIGAIAGGGKGAAIGAAAGGAAGAGAQAVTKGQRVKVPSETRLTFVLETAVKL